MAVDRAVGALRFLDTVGDEDQKVADGELDLDLGERGLFDHAEQAPPDVEFLDRATSSRDERRRVATCRDQGSHSAVRRQLELRDGGRAEWRVGRLFQERFVEQREGLAGAAVCEHARRAQRMAAERRDPSRRRALPEDVSYDDRMAVAAGEDVFKVAADIVAGAGGTEYCGKLQAGHFGKCGRQKACL